MRVRSALLLTAIPLVAVGCANGSETATTSATASGLAATASTDAGAVRQAIDAANARFVDAMKRGDTIAIVENYTEDAVVMPQGAASWQGREAIRKGFTGMLTRATVKEFSMKIDDVTVAGDLAIESGSYEETAQLKDGKEFKDRGKYVVVWKRQADGAWKIVRDIFNSDNPPTS